jgi:monofunctional glycosyltransferase
MAKRKILKFFIYLLSFPFIFLSKLIEMLKIESFCNDLNKCIKIVDKYEFSIPDDRLIQALILAEDHRNDLHPGIDPIGILRAFTILIIKGKIQGASTIEQQFIRVVTGNYKRNIFRKFREQILALILTRYKSKKAIASAYLSIAFFGSEYIGLEGIKKEFNKDFNKISFDKILKFIVLLKYPRPRVKNNKLENKINNRVKLLKKYRKIN